MNPKRLIWSLAIGLMALCASARSRTEAVELYDDYFRAATIAVEFEQQADTIAYWLAVTYEEGDIRVFENSELTFVMRDRSKVTVKTEHRVRRNDVLVRRFPDYTMRYVTCRYPIDERQLMRLLAMETRRVDVTVSRGRFSRYVRGLPLRLARALDRMNIMSNGG